MTRHKSPLEDSIRKQRQALCDLLTQPLGRAASGCGAVWPDRDALNKALTQALKSLPHCKFIYALNTNGIQISDNVSHHGLDKKDFHRDRSNRPYMSHLVPSQDFVLSEAYISLRAKRPSLTAIQLVRDENGKALGFVGADFDLRDLPLTRELYEEPWYWRQLKGDPSIRSGVFTQSRSASAMDAKLDTVLSVVEELMVDHGIFHVMLHFSSSRAVIWLFDDPYRYRLLDIDVLTDANMCLAYPRRPYPKDATVAAEHIRTILGYFSKLRFMDEVLYLRSGTLNIFNGIVGLTFSCDGSHYIPYADFLDAGLAFWLGETSPPNATGY